MRILFNLNATQPIGNTKFHGGGKYGLIVFKRIVEMAPNKVSVFYDNKAFLDEEVLDIINSNKLPQYFKNEFSIYDAARKEGGIIYSPLFAQNDIPDDIKVIQTQHGLRVMEMPYDVTQKYYAAEKKSFLTITKQVVKDKFKQYYQHHVEEIHRQRLSQENLITVTVSNHSKYSILTFFPELEKKNIKVFYSPSTINKKMVVDDYVNPYGKYYLVVSANRWVKNGYRTLKGLDELFSEHPNLKGKVVVTGLSSWSQMSIKIKNKERFILVGYVDEKKLAGLYRYAYLLIYGSLNEGFGYPPLEAMFNGCPVVASAIASIPEVCEDAVLYYNPLLISEMKMRVLQMENEIIRESFIKKGIEQQKKIENRQLSDLDKLCEFILSFVK